MIFLYRPVFRYLLEAVCVNKVLFIRSLIKKLHPTSTQVILVSFLGAILLGTALLMIPASTASGQETSFLTALFTSATSVCVTGLVVVDTFSHWSLFGKVIILVLIQIGGLGVITIWASFMLAFRKRFSLQSRLIIRDYYDLDTTYGLIRFLRQVVTWTFLAEGAGAVLYCFVLIPRYGFAGGLWRSVFTSVSAFCNAGLDIFGPDSMVPFRSSLPMNLITILLIILGGLGYIVWFDVIETLRTVKEKRFGLSGFWLRLHEHTRLVLAATGILILSGTALVYIGEFRNPGTIGNLPLHEQLLSCLFQSVTLRTAGFSTIPQQNLTPFSALTGLFFMFVGGSPAGTAGGVKTVTMAVVLLSVRTYLRGGAEPVFSNRQISRQIVTKATAIITVSFGVTFASLLLLILTNDVSPVAAAYEVFSATGTVGLSMALTPSLNTAGRIIIILAMYAGRIAPISMALFLSFGSSRDNSLRYANGRFLLG